MIRPITNILIAFSTLLCIIALSTTYWAQADVTISGASSKTEALSHLGLRYACTKVEVDGQFQERKWYVSQIDQRSLPFSFPSFPFFLPLPPSFPPPPLPRCRY